MSEDKVEKLSEQISEIRDALLGDYDKRGLISRVATLEKYFKVLSGIAGASVTALVIEALMRVFGN